MNRSMSWSTTQSFIIYITITVLLLLNRTITTQDQFRYGVASNDVQQSSIILWTRSSTASSSITVKVSTDTSFSNNTTTKQVNNLIARQQDDFTVRVLI